MSVTDDLMSSISKKQFPEECCLLGCSAVQISCEPTFQRNILPPSSEYKNPRARNQLEQVAVD
jgi:hypothetical protein